MDESEILEELNVLLGVDTTETTAQSIPDAPTDTIIDQDVIDDLPDAPTSAISSHKNADTEQEAMPA